MVVLIPVIVVVTIVVMMVVLMLGVMMMRCRAGRFGASVGGPSVVGFQNAILSLEGIAPRSVTGSAVGSLKITNRISQVSN